MKRHKVRFKSELIRDFIAKNNLTVAKFCKECGISASTFYALEKGRKCHLTVFYKICVYTKIRANDLIEYIK